MKYIFTFAASLLLFACGHSPQKKNAEKHSLGTPGSPLTHDSEEGDPQLELAYDLLVASAGGDLNKDGVSDTVIVSQNTHDSLRPYILQIFFADKGVHMPDGRQRYYEVVSSRTAIEPQYPFGPAHSYPSGGSSFVGMEIKKGVLQIRNEWIRGHYEYRYRHQNGHFELIGYSSGGGGSGIVETVDFNLMTGLRIHTEESMGDRADYGPEEEYIDREERTKVLIRPLPKLESFEPNTDSRIE